MLNDRKILISVGNHRRSVSWQPQTLLLSELYEKMRIPARSTETMQEYLNPAYCELAQRRIADAVKRRLLYGERKL